MASPTLLQVLNIEHLLQGVDSASTSTVGATVFTPPLTCETPALIGIFDKLGAEMVRDYGELDGSDVAAELIENLAFMSEGSMQFQVTLTEIMEQADINISVVPSEAVAATVPDLMDETVPLDIRMAPEIEQLRVPGIKGRRKKTATPASKKNAAYFARRQKNNIAASLNRARERAARREAKERGLQLAARNSNLRSHVKSLEEELEDLQAREAAAINSSVGNAFVGLSVEEFSLSPPVPVL